MRLAIQLTDIREKHQASFEYIVLNQIKQLGMIDAKFSLSFSTVDDITPLVRMLFYLCFQQIQICQFNR